MNLNNHQIISFWQWFTSTSQPLYQNIKDEDILAELDQKVQALGPFDWEVGPVDDTLLYLAISPNLDEDLLKATCEIISYAPSCEGWSFLNAKPKKEYTPIINMAYENGKKISIDIGTWSYILFHFDDDTFDIDIRISAVEGVFLTLYHPSTILIHQFATTHRILRNVHQK